MVSALGSRVGWTPAHKERTNERLTFETGFLVRRIRTQRAAVRLVLAVSRDVRPQLQLVAERVSALVTDVRPNAEVNLAHVLLQTTTNDNVNRSHRR